jgi:hypothetical protein
MRQTSVIRAWNSVILAVALIPLAIFWSERGTAFRTGDGETDGTWPWHVLTSLIYLLAVVATIAWIRARGWKALVAAAAAVAASVAAAMGFAEIGTAYAFEEGIAGLPLTLAVAILTYLAAANAAWVGLFSIALAVRDRRSRRDRGGR